MSRSGWDQHHDREESRRYFAVDHDHALVSIVIPCLPELLKNLSLRGRQRRLPSLTPGDPPFLVPV